MLQLDQAKRLLLRAMHLSPGDHVLRFNMSLVLQVWLDSSFPITLADVASTLPLHSLMAACHPSAET